MSKKVYDIDAAIERRRAFVKLRGEEYEIKDVSVRERLQKQQEFMEGDESADSQAALVHGMLRDVPDDIASDLTSQEFMLVNRAFSDFFDADAIDFEADEVKNVQPAS